MPPQASWLGRVTRALGRFAVKAATGLLVLAVCIFFFRIVSATTVVQAGTNFAYPQTCLGGWGNAFYASGEPSLSRTAAPHEFTSNNAAYLEPGTSAQLYCSGFSVEARERPPSSVVLSLRLALAGELDEASDPSLGGTTITPATDEQEQTPIEVPALAEPEPDTVPAPEQEEPVQAEQTPDPAEEPVSGNFPWHWLGVHIARAADVPSGSVLEVHYSTDGVSWQLAGFVSHDNWQQVAVSLPVTTWDDLAQLQIKIEAVATTDDRPVVYLDAVELRVDDSITLAENIGDKADAVLGIAETAIGLVNGVADDVLAMLGAEELPPPPVQEPLPAPAPAPVIRTEKKLHFALGGSSVATQRALPWHDDATKAAITKEGRAFLPAPDVSVAADGLSMIVRGECRKGYFVVLTFRDPDDYKERPQTFASNFADECKGGSFSYDFNLLPLDTPEATYYLMVAEQAPHAPWVPTSALLPVTITHTEVPLP